MRGVFDPLRRPLEAGRGRGETTAGDLPERLRTKPGSRMKRHCLCACHDSERVEAEEGKHYCGDCSEEDGRLASYYLGRERTARSLIEGLVELGERGRKWLEER